jgi:Rrf2 family transcriptional regulator, cysteine metabolism repressor
LFTVSAKAIYGLCAMLELGYSYNSGPMQIRDIALAHTIPQHYLEQLLVSMKKAGLVESVRGARGGYSLARHPAEISIIDVLTSLDGRLEVMPERRRENALSFFWSEVEEKIMLTINMSLEELILSKKQHDNQIDYTI